MSLFVVMVGTAIVSLWILDAPRRRDARKFEEWWRRYRERERVTKLQFAWRAGFVRLPDETEDELIARFDRWIGLDERRA